MPESEDRCHDCGRRAADIESPYPSLPVALFVPAVGTVGMLCTDCAQKRTRGVDELACYRAALEEILDRSVESPMEDGLDAGSIACRALAHGQDAKESQRVERDRLEAAAECCGFCGLPPTGECVVMGVPCEVGGRMATE